MWTKKSKKIYALANSICGLVKQNPLPEATFEQAKADSFADYFLQKIVNIRETRKECDCCCPSGECEDVQCLT